VNLIKVVADLHLHSKYSRATSTQLNIGNLEKYAKIKGLGLLGTGDFTHPEWIKELKANLTEDGSGILKTKEGFPFVLQAEVCNMYSQDDKLRRNHHVLLAPSFEIIEQANEYFSKRGKLSSDGRPIFGKLAMPEMVEALKEISDKIEIIPAHIWTPWFSLFGSKSGFDKIEDCYKDQTKHIYALETGLSSDPAMNWRLSALDKYTLISNSDSHSFWPWRIGREANIFEFKELTYDNLIKGLRTRKGLKSTLEFWPEEGKYHFDGHRKCGVCLEPKESIKNNDICPKCGRPLTVGVSHRIEKLADRPEGFVPKKEVAIPFQKLISLAGVISGVMGKGIATKTVSAEYYKLINKFGTELDILLEVPEEEIAKVVSKNISEMIIKNREQKIEVQPGFDGEYGKPIFKESDRMSLSNNSQVKQLNLEEFGK